MSIKLKLTGFSQLHGLAYFLRQLQNSVMLTRNHTKNEPDKSSEWTSQQAETLHQALLSAFNLGSLRRMLRFRLNKQLDHLVTISDFQTTVFNLIEVAEREGWVIDLILEAHHKNPSNQMLSTLAESFKEQKINNTKRAEVAPRDLTDKIDVEQQTALNTFLQRLDPSQEILNNYYKWLVEQFDLPFVKLTLLLDKGMDDPLRFVPDQDKQEYDDLEMLMDKIEEHVIVLLGAPGSGKSTLLRYLQLQHTWRELETPTGQVAFFVPLNAYDEETDGKLPTPMAWLSTRWKKQRLQLELPLFETLFEQGRVLLLLDGLNEMPHLDQSDYRERIGQWQRFLRDTELLGNRILFSCRSLDYSASLGSATIAVRQVRVEPLSAQQIEAFLHAYLPDTGAQVWKRIAADAQLVDLFTSPFYARQLVDQVAPDGSFPTGAATLITNSVRKALFREAEKKKNPLLQANVLLPQRDYEQAFQKRWGNRPYNLPWRGPLIPKLEQLAFGMQANSREGGYVRVTEETALKLLNHLQAESLLVVGVQLNILKHDVDNGEVTFHHQLVQEYFAARILARVPDPSQVQIAWHIADVTPSLEQTVAGLDKGTPLPSLPATGWEETTFLAAAMTADPDEFVQSLMAVNLPLAGRCAGAVDVTISQPIQELVQMALVERLGDSQADLRARIAAAEVLGKLGDPRWTRHTGSHGDYLLPPFAEIAGGNYIIRYDVSQHTDKPTHSITIEPFEMAIYPITNAEYGLFMEAGGYQNERWWQTEAARDWLHNRVDNSSLYQDIQESLQKLSEDNLKKDPSLTSEQADIFIQLKKASDEEFIKQINEWYPHTPRRKQPAQWKDSRFNLPNQPIVGINWYEAKAYCAWLSAQCNRSVTLPSEIEWEAAAGGMEHRHFAFGSDYHIDRTNTFESHIRQTTPVGIYPTGTTPDGIHDLSGNIWEWTSSKYHDPYNTKEEREVVDETLIKRTLRGGSWLNSYDLARSTSRNESLPDYHYNSVGFRVVIVCHPPS